MTITTGLWRSATRGILAESTPTACADSDSVRPVVFQQIVPSGIKCAMKRDTVAGIGMTFGQETIPVGDIGQ